MEYSPRNGNPYISRVDGGTVELVKSFGCDVHPSGDLISLFEATLSDEQLEKLVSLTERYCAISTAAEKPGWHGSQ